jgi:hypothetical protein
MIEVNEFRPNPAAPTLFVNRIGGIYRISPSIKKTDLRAFEQPGRRYRDGELPRRDFGVDERFRCIRAN